MDIETCTWPNRYASMPLSPKEEAETHRDKFTVAIGRRKK